MNAKLFNHKTIQSALDLDVYKINMMCAAYRLYPETQVRYELIVRSDENLTGFKHQIEQEINKLADCHFNRDEIDYLHCQAPHLDQGFLSYLAKFRFAPKQQVTVSVTDEHGQNQLKVSIQGIWHETILYETLVMSIISEVRNRELWSGIPYAQFHNVLQNKVNKLKTELARHEITNFQFSEMGSRRRFSAQVQHDVVDYFRQHAPELMSGTSNYHLAKKFQLTPIGTVAHEWFMAHQRLVDTAQSQAIALDRWHETFKGKLGIALTDTISIDAFLNDFTAQRANAYAGVRHDSGCPLIWGDKMIAHYQALGIDPMSKILIFTDSLDFDRALEICQYFSQRANISFGIGTFLANDMGDWQSNNKRYKPLSMVIKMAQCNGKAVAKISDEPEKAMCEDPLFLNHLKQCFGLDVELDRAS